ncbi:hypothetical protein NDU88_003046 [Pleurodeles waltl]|uniref:Uncharacterized protein n=1 Tax=Pleurodeles waltl TaxID=8319 RepID=A0AAV7QB44_PLEWA|nr:hypothetical protein NDU88_003046 [Pleurodeles waltl]
MQGSAPECISSDSILIQQQRTEIPVATISQDHVPTAFCGVQLYIQESSGKSELRFRTASKRRAVAAHLLLEGNGKRGRNKQSSTASRTTPTAQLLAICSKEVENSGK